MLNTNPIMLKNEHLLINRKEINLITNLQYTCYQKHKNYSVFS